jgi:hypothetical protein
MLRNHGVEVAKRLVKSNKQRCVRVQGIEDTSELHCDVTGADDANLVKELKQFVVVS